MTYPHTGWQDLQPRTSQTYSSQPSGLKLCKAEGSPTRWVTRSLTKLKSNLRWFHVIYFLQDHHDPTSTLTRSCFLHHKNSILIITTAYLYYHKYGALHWERQHTSHAHKTYINGAKFIIEGKHVQWRKIKIIVIVTRHMRLKFQ